MDPEVFIRLSIGSLGLRLAGVGLKTEKSEINELSFPYVCEIRLPGFPVQTKSVPLMSSEEIIPDIQNNASSFYLEESDLKALLAPGCFYNRHACLEIAIFTGMKESYCGLGIKRQQIGIFKIQVGPEWGEGKPMILFNGWASIGKNRQESEMLGAELHVRVKIDPDPRYVFQFEDITTLSPQIVQQQGSLKQPIFSCTFSSASRADSETERRERKGWKVTIHDLSGSAVAAALITTPFVPSTSCDWVDRSNPGAWLIVRPDACRPESWLPWGKLEVWRERGIRDSVCFRFHLLCEDQEGGELHVSEICINPEKGGEFIIDTEKQTQTAAAVTSPIPSSQSSGDSGAPSPVFGGFVMSCRVQGEGKRSKPLVQLAKRHVSCVEDAAIFVVLAAAVDLSIEACRPFHRKIGIFRHSF